MKCPICNNEVNSFNRKRKTLQQLRYFYGVILKILAKELGYEKWEIPNLHYELKKMFLTNTIISKITGEEIEAVPSLANIRKQKMIEYIEELIRWSAQQGIVIPDPKDYYNENPT